MNGKIKDTEFEIPFRNIKSIDEPRGDDECQIMLKSGILVFENGSEKAATNVPWEEVVKIEME